MPGTYGASPDDWAKLMELTKVDLLTTVSNPHATPSSGSKLKSGGAHAKVPSLYIDIDGERYVRGVTKWTEQQTTLPMIEAWKKEPDYGICIQTREVRALDLDLPDVRVADRAEAIFLRVLNERRRAAGGRPTAEVPARVRRSSPRRILAFVVSGLPDGRRGYLKRGSFRADTGLVEFLATGQQFIAAGTHPHGDRYEWRDGLPAAWPEFDWQDVKAALEAIYEELGVDGTWRGFGDITEKRRGTMAEGDLAVNDPVAEHLIESEWPIYDSSGDRLYIECPWKAGHSSDSGETEAAWMLAGTGGFHNGHFHCLHASCAGRKRQDFLKEVGYQLVKPSEFDDLTHEDGGAAAYIALAPSASPKSKELKAEARALAASPSLPLPGFIRDARERIETCLENVVRALRAPHACGAWIAFDEFRGELMMAEREDEWRPLGDADSVRLRITLEALGFKDQIGTEKMRDALTLVGDENRFDSAIKWLREVVPPWDGVPRVRRFWPDYMNTKDTPYTEALGDYTWTAQVDRILNPGCQVDMVPVMVSPEGLKKTSVIAALVPDRMFFGEFSLHEDDTDLARKMRGKLVGELAELRGVSVRDGEAVLSWVTRREEEWTPKFKEYDVTLKRRLLFYGTTNSFDFMKAHMGLRRWLPVVVGAQIDIARIERDRLQLWAEALLLFELEGQLWAEVEELAKAEHEDFREVHKWEHQCLAWLDDAQDIEGGLTPRMAGVRTDQVLEECLGIPAKSVKRSDQMDVAEALKACGMVKEKRWVNGKPVWVWVDAEVGRKVGRTGDRRTREDRT